MFFDNEDKGLSEWTKKTLEMTIILRGPFFYASKKMGDFNGLILIRWNSRSNMLQLVFLRSRKSVSSAFKAASCRLFSVNGFELSVIS